MRKYLLSWSLISAVASALPALKLTQETQSKLRIVATWVTVAASITLAIAAVREEAADARSEELD